MEKIYIALLFTLSYESARNLGNGGNGGVDYISIHYFSAFLPKMKIQNVLFAIGALIAVILMLWYIFGNSPSLDQILVGLMVANFTLSFKIHGDLQKHLGEHEGSKQKTIAENKS